MADFCFNVAKGKIAYYASLPAANDALKIVLLKATGIETDAVLKDYDTVSAILAASNDEADFTGASRKTLASVTVNLNDTADEVWIDAADPSSWTNSGGSAQTMAKALIYYDPDTTASSDTNNIPICCLDYAVTFDVGVPGTLTFGSTGFCAAT